MYIYPYINYIYISIYKLYIYIYIYINISKRVIFWFLPNLQRLNKITKSVIFGKLIKICIHTYIRLAMGQQSSS